MAGRNSGTLWRRRRLHCWFPAGRFSGLGTSRLRSLVSSGREGRGAGDAQRAAEGGYVVLTQRWTCRGGSSAQSSFRTGRELVSRGFLQGCGHNDVQLGTRLRWTQLCTVGNAFKAGRLLYPRILAATQHGGLVARACGLVVHCQSHFRFGWQAVAVRQLHIGRYWEGAWAQVQLWLRILWPSVHVQCLSVRQFERFVRQLAAQVVRSFQELRVQVSGHVRA